MKNQYKMRIGLEIHAQIKTKTKLFSTSIIDDSAEINTNLDFFDLSLPGTLPIINKKAINLALKAALALNMTIPNISIFDRKHYFYPDLPVGYQITQFYHPIGLNGYINCSFGKINIERLHIESDAGKIINEDDDIFIDLNRYGVGLMEIVTKPDFFCIEQVLEFLKELRLILIAVESSSADMEKGNFRVDVNISVNKDNEELGTRVEIKNLNSFTSIKKAIEYEYQDQISKLKNGVCIKQETKLFNVDNNKTRTLRVKEDASEYGYFPDPDLLPIKFTDLEIQLEKQNLPILPQKERQILQNYGLTLEQANIVIETELRKNFIYFLKEKLSIKIFMVVINLFVVDILGALNKKKISFDFFIKNRKNNFINDIFYIMNLYKDNQITLPNIKILINKMIESDFEVNFFITKYNFLDNIKYNLDEIIDKLLITYSNERQKYFKNNNIIKFFVGLVMKETNRKIDAVTIEIKLKEKLES